MSQDFNSRNYPFLTQFAETATGEESETEPASEDTKSAVQGYDHPMFSSDGMINIVNYNRGFSNSIEDKLSGKVQDKTIKDLIQNAYKQKFPVQLLMFSADLDKKLTDRSDMSDASSIIQKLSSYVNGFGRPPKNFELFMAYAVDGVGPAQQLIQKALDKPNDKATPIGSKHDDIIFYKKKFDDKVLRTNKEVVQFFAKRMLNGSDFFPHLPLGVSAIGH